MMCGVTVRSAKPGDEVNAGGAVVVCVGALLAGIVPILVIKQTPGPPEAGWQIALAITVWSGLRIAVLLNRAVPRLTALAYYLFCYVWFGLAAMAQLRTGSEPDTTPGLAQILMPRSMAIIAVGMVAFEVFAVFRLPPDRASVSTSRRSLDLSRASLLGWIGVLFAIYFIRKIGVSNLFTSRDAADLAVQGTWTNPTTAAVFKALAIMPLLIAVHAVTRLRRQQRAAGGTATHGFWLALFTVVLLIVANPISNARYLAGTVLLSLLVLLGAFNTPGRFRLTTVIVILGVIAIFPYADRFRHSDVSGAKPPLLTSLETSGDYDALAQVNNTVRYVDERGYTNGRQALGVVLFFVPRNIWSGKPDDTGVVLANYRGYRFNNLSAPLWAELFINFSWGGVIIGMGLLGVAVRRLDEHLVSDLGRASPGAVAASCLAFYLLIILRGSLLQATAYLVVILGSVLLVSRKTPTSPIPASGRSPNASLVRSWSPTTERRTQGRSGRTASGTPRAQSRDCAGTAP